MRRNIKKKAISLGVTMMMFTAMMPLSVSAKTTNFSTIGNVSRAFNAVDVSVLKNNHVVKGDITVDKDLDDWNSVTARNSSDSNVENWKIAISSDYSTLYFCYNGTSSSEWDYNYLGNNKIAITYSDGSQGKNNMIQFSGWSDGAYAKDGWYGDISGAYTVTQNSAHGNTAGPYTVESSIPMDFFANGDFTMTFAGTTIKSSDIEVLSGETAKEEDETQEAVYNGITIDGSYKDWNAVTKYDAKCPNEEHPDCLSKAAMVFDGDYIYIYVKDGKGTAAGAGTHSNGKFVITTDLGRELLIQLNRDGTVSGVENAQCSHVGSEWEIAVPKSALPKYLKTISFGLYQAEPFVKDVSNLSASEEDAPPAGGPIVYDGLYGDWDTYPHTLIQYATAGTHETVPDGEAALASDGSTLYGHVETEMPAHLAEKGGEFTYAVTVRFNRAQDFYPRFATVDQNGNINWNPQIYGLSNGTYEFYIFSLDSWGTSSNISALNSKDQWYGKMTMTIGEDKDQCEYYLDLSKIAEKFNCDTSDFKQIEAQYGRIGQEWVTTAGASSGAWLGLLICVSVCGGVLVYRKKKGEKSVAEK